MSSILVLRLHLINTTKEESLKNPKVILSLYPTIYIFFLGTFIVVYFLLFAFIEVLMVRSH